jgi:hypothetical protein
MPKKDPIKTRQGRALSRPGEPGNAAGRFCGGRRGGKRRIQDTNAIKSEGAEKVNEIAFMKGKRTLAVYNINTI